MTTYTVYVENKTGATACTVTISVRIGQCATDGMFPNTRINEVGVYECAMKGAYVGTQKRACVLGEKDGEWQKTSGLCISIPLIVIVIVAVIALIVVVVFVFIRSTKQAKSVGGVKGKKSLKHTTETKKSGKMMKV